MPQDGNIIGIRSFYHRRDGKATTDGNMDGVQ